ncbi:hypothetical protein CMUS01_10106 [Colletotrichum musicola]|uniref:Uncharacterized protein n=1 Tax=Colletotrichum musicola TaxID=2175873 RepID=A0A8H6K4M5_9PEZI|nr:hypothetical protein CMUS01_10106 [Colletotrichum musicola]
MVKGAKILGFMFNAQKSLFPVSWSFEPGIPDRHIPETWVTLMLGTHKELTNGRGGGREPYISLWDDEGRRLGQHWVENYKYIPDNNDLNKHVYKIQHLQNRDPSRTTRYVMISQFKLDDICLAAVQVSNGKESTVWHGDLGEYCGVEWFLSERSLPGKPDLKPKCIWLRSEKGGARSISWHTNDMLGTPSKLEQYKKDQKKYLCESTPRFGWWYNLGPSATPPFYRPPLKYAFDKEAKQEGGMLSPTDTFDMKLNHFDKDVAWMNNPAGTWDKMTGTEILKLGKRSQQPEPESPEAQQPEASNSTERRDIKRRGFNKDPSHLIITEAEGHEASLVCNSSSSYGWDVASRREGKYCDMTVRKLYDLCDSIHKSNCFDLERKVLVGHGGISARGEVSALGVPKKAYDSTAHWK